MALRTLGQLTPQIQVPPQDDLDASRVSLTPGWLFLPWHLIAFPTRKTISLLVHLLFPSRANPQNTLSENLPSFHVKVQSQGHSLASILSFFFFSSVKCLYILSKNIPCTGTVTSLYFISPQQTTKAFEGGRKGERTDRREGTREVWWRKEIYRTPLLG